MTEPLIFDGLTYLPIKDAAAGSHFSTEYLARLARSGRVRARMAGGMWFFETRSLQQFLSVRERVTRCCDALSVLITYL